MKSEEEEAFAPVPAWNQRWAEVTAASRGEMEGWKRYDKVVTVVQDMAAGGEKSDKSFINQALTDL